MQSLNLQETKPVVNRYDEIVVLKNNKNNVIYMSMEKYKKNISKEEIIKSLKKSEKEIEEKQGIESDEAFNELRKKYGYWI